MSIRSTITVLALAAGFACAGTALACNAEAAGAPGAQPAVAVVSAAGGVNGEGVNGGGVNGGGGESAPAGPTEGDWRHPQCLLCWLPGRPNPGRGADVSPPQA